MCKTFFVINHILAHQKFENENAPPENNLTSLCTSISSSRSWWVCGVAIRAKGANTLQFSISMFGKMSCNNYSAAGEIREKSNTAGRSKTTKYPVRRGDVHCFCQFSRLNWIPLGSSHKQRRFLMIIDILLTFMWIKFLIWSLQRFFVYENMKKQLSKVGYF